MSDEERDARAKRQFFQSAILEPTFDPDQDFYFDAETTTVLDLGAIEAVHWALLGVKVGYLDANDALQLISSAEGVLQAWHNLMERQIISPEDVFAKVIRPGDGGQFVVNAELFSVAPEVDPGTQDLLLDAFQTFLLLTAENILDGYSHYFLDSIGWTDRKEWEARREGITAPWGHSSQVIGSGFANVLNYWREMALMPHSMRPEGMIWSSSVLPGPVSDLTQAARWIMNHRFNLGHIEIIERYFEVAGEFVERAREDTPAWMDARFRVFQEMLWLTSYVGARNYVREDRERLWKVFTEGIKESPTERETRREGRRSERQ